jgi:hypothetical protein
MKQKFLVSYLLRLSNDRRFRPLFFVLAAYFIIQGGKAAGKFLYYVLN